MKISEFFKNFSLHDSGIDRIVYFSDEKRMVVHLELCNYMQAGYQEGELELVPGHLEFLDVSGLDVDPPLSTIDWEIMSGEISSGGHVAERDRDDYQAAEFLIHVTNFRTHENTLYTIRFLCRDVVWTATITHMSEGQ